MTDYLFSSAQYARIRAAEEAFDEGTERILTSLDFDRNGVALEVGAGGGSIARFLCALMSDGGSVVATDLDTAPLEREDNPPNLEIRRHDVITDSLEPGHYVLVHARLLLEHLPARLEVLRKLVAALAPNGVLVVEDVDYAGAVPVSDFGAVLHERVQSVRLEAFAKSGIDHYLGRELPRLLREAGLVDVRHDGRVQLMEGRSPGARWLKLSLDFLRPRLTGPELLEEREIDEMIVLLEDERFSAIGPTMFAVWGRKPDRT